VVVPHELPFELHDLHVAAVELGDDAQLPPVVEAGELVGEVDDFDVRDSFGWV
jgi:hypothetical protein